MNDSTMGNAGGSAEQPTECKPLVSVIVPVYNVEKYLARCLDSIVGQTYQSLEIILINDGSTDSSSEICQQYVEKDERIHLFTQKNQGLSAARNTGLDHMNGEYVMFVDSDDYISVHFVEIVLNKLLEYDVKIAICDRLVVDDTDDSADIDQISLRDIGSCVKMSKDDIFEQMYKSGSEKYIVVWGKLYHREIFENLRFERGRICEDEFIFHKIYIQVEDVCWIDHALYAYRQSTNSIMRTDGVFRTQPDGIDAFLGRLSFFQNYGNTKFIKNTENAIFEILHELMGQMGDSELRGLIVRTEQEVYRITGIKPISMKRELFKWSPKMYRITKKYYRAARHILGLNGE